MAMVSFAIYRSSQSKQLMKGSSMTGQGPPKLVILHMDLAIHTLDDIMRNTGNLNEKFIIGYGAYSTVYKRVLKNSRPIAIKRLYNQHPNNLREFETELKTIGSIRHRNLSACMVMPLLHMGISFSVTIWQMALSGIFFMDQVLENLTRYSL